MLVVFAFALLIRSSLDSSGEEPLPPMAQDLQLCLVCLLGLGCLAFIALIGTEIWARRPRMESEIPIIAPLSPEEEPTPFSEPLAVVRWISRKADAYRCRLITELHPSSFGGGVLLCGITVIRIIAGHLDSRSLLLCLVSLPCALAFWGTVIGLFLYWETSRAYPRGNDREASVCLTVEGMDWRTPQLIRQIPWCMIRDIVLRRGDLYFWMENGSTGLCIPRSAWENDAERHQFYAAALGLWKAGASALLPGERRSPGER